MGLKRYSPAEIDVFKLRARIRKLERELERELVQGNLWPPMQDELKQAITHEVQRLKNRLVRMEQTLNG